MHLYSASGGGRAQYHCFACGAHGDVFDLIKRQLNKDFQGALEWLAGRYRFMLPSGVTTVRGERIEPRTLGLVRGFDIYRKQIKPEAEALRKWSAERQIDLSVLQEAEVFAAFPQKIANHSDINDREVLDALDTAGLLLRGPATRNRESAVLPLDIPPRDFYSSQRVIFTIRDDRGAITGFAGRAIGQEQPKYLFSPGFPRGSTLYRLNKVREALSPRRKKGGQSVVHMFVVEGLMDALRLESIGLHAVALLGSHITENQVKLLTDLASDLDRDKRKLAIHLLLDADEAGQRGTVNATVKLLEACAETSGMSLDVLTPLTSELATDLRGHDPDELFRDVKDSDAALARLSLWCEAPMKVLLSTAMEVTTAELDSTWDNLSEAQHIQAFRDVERRLDRHRWISILDRVPAFDRHLRTSSIELSSWQEPLRRYLLASRGRPNVMDMARVALLVTMDG